jgi:hypothetical protein
MKASEPSKYKRESILEELTFSPPPAVHLQNSLESEDESFLFMKIEKENRTNALSKTIKFRGMTVTPFSGANIRENKVNDKINIGLTKQLAFDLKLNMEDSPMLSSLHMTMIDFPADAHPGDFFSAKIHACLPFVNYCNKKLKTKPLLSLHRFNLNSKYFYKSSYIELTRPNSEKLLSFFPFSFAFLMAHWPEGVRIFFSHEVVTYFLALKEAIPSDIELPDLLIILSNLQEKYRKEIGHSLIERRSRISEDSPNLLVPEPLGLEHSLLVKPDKHLPGTSFVMHREPILNSPQQKTLILNFANTNNQKPKENDILL